VAGETQVDDVSDVIDALATGIYTVSRPGQTTYLNGRRQPPTTTSFDIRAAVQPATGRQLDRLPEGLRTHEAIAIWTRTELRTENANGEPDVISVGGFDYQIDAVNRWQPSGGYFMALATRVSSP
jgi:hypothetical protein